MNIKAYGKINIGLDVVGRRPDGYHLVKMVMQTVPVFDELTFTKTSGAIVITCDNPNVPTDSQNLAHKAAIAFKEKYNIEDGVTIDIKKNIPAAAGMAGGSADAAATLKAMASLYNIETTKEELDDLAVGIGADVPFCLREGTYLSEGVGEVLTKLNDFPKCYCLLINPGIEVSTKWAYEELDKELEEIANKNSYETCAKPLANTCTEVHPNIDALTQAINKNDLQTAVKYMGNVLEIPVLKKYPEIKSIKDQLEDNGAIKALMSGSGSSVFGIFGDEEKMRKANEQIKGEGYVRFSFEFR